MPGNRRLDSNGFSILDASGNQQIEAASGADCDNDCCDHSSLCCASGTRPSKFQVTIVDSVSAGCWPVLAFGGVECRCKVPADASIDGVWDVPLIGSQIVGCTYYLKTPPLFYAEDLPFDGMTICDMETYRLCVGLIFYVELVNPGVVYGMMSYVIGSTPCYPGTGGVYSLNANPNPCTDPITFNGPIAPYGPDTGLNNCAYMVYGWSVTFDPVP